MTLEEALVSVWRQALVGKADIVKLAGQEIPVRRTPKRGLRQVDFTFDGQQPRGLEQNPETKSHWAQLARAGKRVMQFLSAARYIAVVVDGKLTLYGGSKKTRRAKIR
ncbi:MAG: hypothetical protein ACRD5M_00550 [Candidatus Acidiferrales bacterium]